MKTLIGRCHLSCYISKYYATSYTPYWWPLLNLYFTICSYSTILNLFLVFIKFDVVHLFLPLDLRMFLVLLSMFDRHTCLVYYIYCWVSLYLGYSPNGGIGLILALHTLHPTAPSRLLGYGCQPYFLVSIVYFAFPFIFIMSKHKILSIVAPTVFLCWYVPLESCTRLGI